MYAWLNESSSPKPHLSRLHDRGLDPNSPNPINWVAVKELKLGDYIAEIISITQKTA